LFSLILAASAWLAAQADEEAAPHCRFDRSLVLVRRFAEVPPAVREDILRDGAIAEAGQPFTPYDDISDPSLPVRRFVLAGTKAGQWFVWIDHGGFARHNHVLGYYPVSYGFEKRPRLMRAANFIGAPCAAIEAFFKGVITGGVAD
jgi:hypothetical protein